MDELSKEKLREEQTRLIRIVEAIEALEKSVEWSTLKELVFSTSLESIERQLKLEALNETINEKKLYHLQGQYSWANRFCDTDKYAETLKKQLEEIKKKL